MGRRITRGVRCALVLAAVAAVLAAPGGGQARQESIARSLALGAKLAYHRETGEVRYLTTLRGHPVSRPARIEADAKPAVAARAFLADHGSLFGIDSQARELRTERTRVEAHGRSFVRFQQVHEGVPVMGGELVVQLDGQGNTVATTGEVLPDLTLDVEATIAARTAQERAVAFVAKARGVVPGSLIATAPQLQIYDSRLLGGPGVAGPRLVWRTDVTGPGEQSLAELVLVDARLGTIALHFSLLEEARDRRTYTANNTTTLPGTIKCLEASAFPACAGGDADVESAHRIAGAVYDFYFSRHGRDSYDNAGSPLVTSVHYRSNYDNAAFDSVRNQMLLGDARTYAQADDAIAHEITHGVTARESNLFYYYQSGAINESLSDVFGEFIDLTDGIGNDSPAVRWIMGEDVLPGGGDRSLKDPPVFGQPDRMTSPNWAPSESDAGGVHTNSGVGNKAAYLMSDGDTFNGKTVTGIGLDKTEAIFYEAAANLLTSASDYQDLYNALQQACSNLVGTLGITSGDCQQVKNAVDAVEMNVPPTSGAPIDAPVCTTGVPTNLFFDNLESPGSGNWTTGVLTGSNSWFYPQNPNPGSGFDATNATSGVTNFFGIDRPTRSDTFIAQTASVALPPGTTSYLRFNHAYHFEHDGTSAYYDGGVVEYSTNNGASWNDAGPLFTHGGYRGPLPSQFGNPLGGRQGFGGQSNGYGSSRLDLGSLAGQSVRFRFRIGTDGDTGFDLGFDGWFVDDVRIYRCLLVPDAPTNVTATPGDGAATVSFTVPPDNGSPITSYTVRVSPGGQAVMVFSNVVSIPGLTNGTAYTFTVSATSAVGEGPQSAPTAPVTPVAAPSRPGTTPPAAVPRVSIPDPPVSTRRPPLPGSAAEF